MSGDEVEETFSDRFLDLVLEKGLVWLLYGVGVLAVVVAAIQVARWLS